ncbi:MAG: hypothetical protein NWE98_05160 [Candidatus Bathyarchaeota archaeon]|nr:hypothetical protein [Candidatus Bathyarchaeota archaeon]
MKLGFFENFPASVHYAESFNSTLSSRSLQQRLIQALYDVNRQEFSFEQIAIPTVPEGRVIFEFGLAESENFNFIDKGELKKALDFLAQERVNSLDLFCAVRYYRGNGQKKTPLKFDYFILRTVFSKDLFEIQVFHERGPRYLSPEDVVAFIFLRLNCTSNRGVLRRLGQG